MEEYWHTGRNLLDGGGPLVLESDGPFIGPRHAGIVSQGGRERFSCHVYDASQNGRPTYALRPVTWDTDGWPVVGKFAAPRRSFPRVIVGGSPRGRAGRSGRRPTHPSPL